MGNRAAYYRRRTLSRVAALDAIKLERGCIDCGYNSHAAALDFDHVEAKRDATRAISKMVVSAGWDRILAEVERCVVRCANCHRVKTIEMQRAHFRGQHTQPVAACGYCSEVAPEETQRALFEERF